MKYLQKTFSSQPSTEEFRQNYDASLPGGEPIGPSLMRCPQCGTYFAAKQGWNVCPKPCGWSAQHLTMPMKPQFEFPPPHEMTDEAAEDIVRASGLCRAEFEKLLHPMEEKP